MCDHCGCREHPPIADLTAEHEAILARVWGLVEASRHGAPSARPDVDNLLSLLDAHVAKEETGLYPTLQRRSVLGPDQLEDLEEEHRETRRRLVAGEFDRVDYYALAAHVEVEETELFPRAMLDFDADDWDAMERTRRAVEARAAAAGSP